MKKYILTVALLGLAACSSHKKINEPKNSKPINVQIDKEVKVSPTKEVIAEVKETVEKTKENINSNLSSTTLAYVQEYAPLAMEEMHKFKIPASITLAQGILESGSGTSNLAKKSNNHFGIKCHTGWKGAKVYHDDDHRGECFRKYKYTATSYQDHSLFLTSRFRYASLFKLDSDDYKGWAKGLKKAGYATDSKYPKKLISYIEKYELYKYDEMVLKGKGYQYLASGKEAAENSNSISTLEQNNNNTSKIYLVEKEDTLYSISKKYGISVDDIKSLNGLGNSVIHKGDVLRLYGTQNDEAKKYHVVEQKETLYSISKQYSLTIEELKAMNLLEGNEISIGQELRVK